MRVVFLTQEDPLYLFPFFDMFFAALQKEGSIEHIEICSVFACRIMGGRKRYRLIRELLILYGYVGLSKLLWLQLKARLLSSRVFSLLSRHSHSIQQLCFARNINYERIDNPNSPETLEKLRNQMPDVLVSVACPHILNAQSLCIPKVASINIHHAPLPRYKGMMPTFWQMYHGESTVGLTIHTMAEKVDEGEILLQESLTIDPDESLHQLIQRSKRHGAGAMLKVLKKIQDGTVFPQKMTQEQASYFTFPTKHEMREFHRRRLRAI